MTSTWDIVGNTSPSQVRYDSLGVWGKDGSGLVEALEESISSVGLKGDVAVVDLVNPDYRT